MNGLCCTKRITIEVKKSLAVFQVLKSLAVAVIRAVEWREQRAHARCGDTTLDNLQLIDVGRGHASRQVRQTLRTDRTLLNL